MTLTFYGGVGEIGGNKILLEDSGTRIFLDFGKNFGKERRYYEPSFLQPRSEDHLLGLGILDISHNGKPPIFKFSNGKWVDCG